MTSVSVKEQILDLLPKALRAHQDFIDSLTETERGKVGTPQEWAAKDILSHCTYWQEIQSERLAAAMRGETPPNTDDFQALNETSFTARRDRPWTEVKADLDQCFQLLTKQIQALSEADLSEAGRFAWQNQGRPLWRSICGNVYMHPCQHFSEFYLKRGDAALAQKVQETIVENVSILDNGSWRGTSLYNMACFYALAGESQQAISLLAQSLKLDPSLTEWSKQDSDLVSLRELPAYKALYAA